MKALLGLVLVAGCTTTAAAGRVRLCSLDYSPNGDHVVLFDWDGGGAVTAVACSFECEPVLRFSATTRVGYRWTDANRLEIADPRGSSERLLTRIRSLAVYAVPAAQFSQRGGSLAQLNSRSCPVAETVVIE
jgi:hypothetical protein